MNNLDFLTIFDTVILVLNILFIYLFLKKEKFYFINLIISVNAIRLFYSYLVFDNVWWLRHSLAIALLLLINLLDTKKIMHFIYPRYYWKIPLQMEHGLLKKMMNV